MPDAISLDKSYWTERYEHNQTGWDIGDVSTPIKEFIDQIDNKNLKILIPGAGNSYEAEYFHKLGFRNVWVADISKIPLEHLRQRVPDFPKNQLLNLDFFVLEDKYDLIIEQTFFCAIEPRLRKNYVTQMNDLLNNDGELVGLLFNASLNDDKPPFGGNKEDYIELFEEHFEIKKMEEAYNSIPPRKGNELFFRLSKLPD